MSPVYDHEVGVMNEVALGASAGNGAKDQVRYPVTVVHQLAYMIMFASILSACVPLLAIWMCASGHHEFHVVVQVFRFPPYHQLVF
jgi:hypothetical protein